MELLYAIIELDACLTGFGGVFDNMVYHLALPKNYKNYNITQLELLNILVVLKVWAYHWADKKIYVKCHNLVSVEVLKMGRACDPVMATIAKKYLVYYSKV